MTRQADDIDRIMAVMDAAFDPVFGEAWTRRQIEDSLMIGTCHYGLVDGSGGTPPPGADAAGFWLSRHSFGEEELLLFAVAPAFRRRGLGLAMLEALVDAVRGRGARRLLLEMRRGNPAEALYRRVGFCPVGERPQYYRGPDGTRVDAITFAKPIE